MCDTNDKLTSLVPMVNQEVNTNKMLRALSAIALEMQRFHTTTPIPYNIGGSQEICERLSLCKSNIRLKRKQIKLLKQNLRNACVVAKTVMSAKDKETKFLHDHMKNARTECIDLYQKNINNKEAIQHLTLNNQSLMEKIKNFEEFTELGYIKLQKIRNSRVENIPTVMKLKEILLACGQYYADYSNEFETRKLLEQRNRFLNSKIKILVNNLEAVAEELKSLRYQNSKLHKENVSLKNKFIKQIENGSLKIDNTNTFVQENHTQFNDLENGTVRGDPSLDFTYHLSLVNNLLNDQDNMLKYLKKLSEQLNLQSIPDLMSDSSTKS